MTWQERCAQLQALSIDPVVTSLLGDLDEDLGALVDRATALLVSNGLIGNDRELLARLVELALHPEGDFRTVATLEQSPNSRVDIVRSSLARPGSVYVRKSVSKSFAMRMRGCSPANERQLLVSALFDTTPYIPRLLAAMHDDTSLYVVIEYLPCGTVLDLIEAQEGGRMAEELARLWTAETIQAISWIHDQRFAHRDIKPNNLLLAETGHVKLTDFGSSAPFADAEQTQGPFKLDSSYCFTPVGTVDYIAPEILLAHQSAIDQASFSDASQLAEDASYGPEVDWWSTAVMFYEMLTGTTPFYAPSIPETYERITSAADYLLFPEDAPISDAAIQLMTAMLRPAEERLGRYFGAAEYQSHAYFANFDFDRLHEIPLPVSPPPRELPPASSVSSSLDPNFSLSAFLTSPGLSVLRSLTPPAPTESWSGFTYSPPPSAFDSSTAYILPSTPREQAHAFATPARATSAPPPGTSGDSAVRSRSRRAIGGDLEALRELADYGALKSAQKRRSTPAPVPRPSPPTYTQPRPRPAAAAAKAKPVRFEVVPPSPSGVINGAEEEQQRRAQAEELEARHAKLLCDIDALDTRLTSLSARARSQPIVDPG